VDTLLLNSDGQPLSFVPLSTVTWQVAMRLLFTNKVKTLKTYDDWVVRSQHTEWQVPSIVIMTDHVKWNRGLKYSRNNVYLRDDFTCQLQTTWRCKEQHGKVKHTLLTLDHVVPRSHGGKTNWLNVCTSCKECNSEKGNDHTIVPKRKPHKPTYYEILNKRKQLPIYIRDADWAYYLDWPEHLINVVPHTPGAAPAPDPMDVFDDAGKL
jgi:5-methylcytosine-specific restriction endonuclease McrA